MKTLEELQDLGVKELSVSNGQAVAVNPHQKHFNNFINGYYEIIPVWQSVNNLPPLPCHESVKEGTYPIDRFEEGYNYRYNGAGQDWHTGGKFLYDSINKDGDGSTRIVLVLKEPIDTNAMAILQSCNPSYALASDSHVVTVKVALQAMKKYKSVLVLSEPVAESDPKKGKQWKRSPFECPKCGDEAEVFTKSRKSFFFYDEEEVRCSNPFCLHTGSITVEDDECVDVIWDEVAEKPEGESQNDLLMDVAEIASNRLYYNKIGFTIPEQPLIIGSSVYKDKKLFDESKDKWQFDALGFIRELKEKGYSITKPSPPEAEPVESAEEKDKAMWSTLQKHSRHHALVYENDVVTVRSAISAMEEYADIKAKEALGK